MDYTQDTPPAEIGEYIARVYRWDGEKIFAALMAALTEANYHTEAAALAQTWHTPRLNETLLNALQQLAEAATHHQADARAAIGTARAAIKYATQSH